MGRFLLRRIALLLACASCLTTGVALANRTGDTRGLDMWQPYWLDRGVWIAPDADPEMLARKNRHFVFMNIGLPEDYENAESTVEPTEEAIAKGRTLYMTHCSSCHGADGLGNDVTARSLSPSPALLRHMIRHPVSVDAYLLWTISEGGALFSTDMPAYRDKLTRKQIWQIVAFMRAGFPPAPKSN